MWNWLRRNYAQTEQTGSAHWLAANENRWGLVVLDCTRVAHGMHSVTTDRGTAESYAKLRGSDGAELRSSSLNPASSSDCDLHYQVGKHPRDGPVFKSRVMEEKWDIYCYDGRLYFCRSWSGKLVYRATFRCELPTFSIVEVEATAKTDGKVAAREVDFLVKSHLLSSQALHPLPKENDKDAHWLAMFSFSNYGRLGLYGTMEETIGTPYFSEKSVSS